MWTDARIWCISWLCIIIHTTSIGQIESSYVPSLSQGNVLDYLDDISNVTGVSLTFSSTQMDAERKHQLPVQRYTIGSAISILLAEYDIELVPRGPEKLVLVINGLYEEKELFGFVKGAITGEHLHGATIYAIDKAKGTFSNAEGYYNLSGIYPNQKIRVSYVGYKDTIISIPKSNDQLDIILSPQVAVSTIIISDKYNYPLNPDNGGDILQYGAPEAQSNILGDEDLFQIARINAAISSGSEGQGGLQVRSGSIDQNLIMLDGVPLYAVNHMADISSIFLKEATRDAQLITSGFPSRYSGRLSSVLSVHLKDGHQEKIGGSASAGLPGIKLFLEGPLTEKTTFMLGGRKSWLNALLDPVINAYSVFEDVDVKYHDLVGKITHQIDNNSSLSISSYHGGDDVTLDKLTVEKGEVLDFVNDENTRVRWNNRLVSVQYHNILSRKWQLKAQAGWLSYGYRSGASYRFVTSQDEEVITDKKRSVVTNSEISNSIANIDLDYYHSAQHRFKFGAQYYYHDFSPKVSQANENISLPNIETNPDSTTIGHQWSAYIEDTYTPHQKLKIYAGLNLSQFGVRAKTYTHWQPRLSVHYTPNEHILMSGSATRMVQFVHLLENNGLGLPSELWVPSTDKIAPEQSDQYDISIQAHIHSTQVLRLSAYIKQQNNIIIYSNPEGLFGNVLNSTSSAEINFRNDRDWEREIETGKRDAYGIELSYRFQTGKWSGNLSYAKNISRDQFDNIQSGTAFRSNLDRPNDININLAYQLSSKWTLGTHWIYGSGSTFTLSLLEFDSVLGVSLLTSDTRNNYRMPAYHHLDLNAKYDLRESGKGWIFNFGIYNVYNRLNPYYLYLYESPASNRYVLKKLSLFPIFPHLDVSYSF